MVLAAIGQICSTASMAHNLAQCQKLVSKAVAAGAKALFLPEASDYIASSPTESVALCRSVSTSLFVLGLQSCARQHCLPINVGIHEPTAPPSQRIKNTLIWIDENGNIKHRYQKLHLFDVDLRSDGGPVIRESDSVEPGVKIVSPIDTCVKGLGKMGLMICFDLRFPEISLALKRQGAEVLVYPSAFTVPTGKAHWETLLKARAVECQAWVVAAAQCGRHNDKRVSYGETMVCSPRGDVAGRLERVTNAEKEIDGMREPDLLLVDLDMEVGRSVRRSMPLLRRTDVYPEV